MKNYSLGTKVTVFFGFCVFLLFISMFTFGKLENEKELEKFKDRHFQAVSLLSSMYKSNTPPDSIKSYFSKFGLKTVENVDLAKYVLTNGVIVFQRLSDLGMVTIYQYNKKYYLFLENDVNIKVLLESTSKIPNSQNIIWLFTIAFILLTWAYLSTLSSIAPLKKLRQTVRRFASGDLYAECKSDRNDDIGELSNEFDKAVRTIRDLVTSRQLFLRTIMHELKTPIGKGRILTEMVKDDIQQQRFKSIFERLEVLIDGFSKMEQILSKNYQLIKQDHSITEILENAFETLLLEPEQLKKRVEVDLGKKSLHLNADIDVMTLAFKNLIDNALKYSSDKKVSITLTNNTIIFSNKGEQLKRSMSELMQPFITTAKKEHDQTGLGLGLYIVENILKTHQLDLKYKYKDETHYFYINLSKLVIKHKDKK